MNKNYKKFPVGIVLVIALINFLFFFLAYYFTHLTNGKFWSVFIVILLSSIFSGVITAFGFFVFNPVFNEVASVLRRFIRFENLSHPLLLRMSYEAPGTFHHSVNVSILAQKAAKTVGADTLLVRIGAYYHDIGKLKNPAFFIENQSGYEVPVREDSETIHQSSRKIIAHVKEGLEIAAENHLPEEICSMIAEHHGTTRVLYFYEEAKKRGLRVRKTDFRYSGPLPQSKESAILMLADSAEAATRAISNLTKEKISEIVENALLDKLNDKQFGLAGFDNDDLAKIKVSLAETLTAIYHQRLIERK